MWELSSARWGSIGIRFEGTLQCLLLSSPIEGKELVLFLSLEFPFWVFVLVAF